MEFAVITKVFPTDMATGLADIWIQTEQPKQENGYTGALTELAKLDFGLALATRVPVFTVGEILVLDESGREVNGKGRKPSKWTVQYDVFTDIQGAIAQAIAVSQSQEF